MKLTTLMEGHLNRKRMDEQKGDLPRYAPQDLPIKAKKKSKWEILKNPNRYRREFNIKDAETYSNFIQDVLELQEETQHHAKILLIYPKIVIEVYTHLLNDVTEVDRDWCNTVNQIYSGYAS
tara:strand:+ start:67 stop:432 length:366 start_codon:yes stop_codon:yes gene_type:complete